MTSEENKGRVKPIHICYTTKTTFDTFVAKVQSRGVATAYTKNDSLRLIINSPYGDWSFRWYAIGSRSFTSFLAECDIDYLGSKLLGAAVRQTDDEASYREILRYFDENELYDFEEHRDEYEELKSMDACDFSYSEWVMTSTLDDAYEFRMTRTCTSWQQFWSVFWEPHIQPMMRDYHGEQ